MLNNDYVELRHHNIACFHTGWASFFCFTTDSLKNSIRVETKECINLASSPNANGDKLQKVRSLHTDFFKYCVSAFHFEIAFSLMAETPESSVIYYC